MIDALYPNSVSRAEEDSKKVTLPYTAAYQPQTNVGLDTSSSIKPCETDEPIIREIKKTSSNYRFFEILDHLDKNKKKHAEFILGQIEKSQEKLEELMQQTADVREEAKLSEDRIAQFQKYTQELSLLTSAFYVVAGGAVIATGGVSLLPLAMVTSGLAGMSAEYVKSFLEQYTSSTVANSVGVGITSLSFVTGLVSAFGIGSLPYSLQIAAKTTEVAKSIFSASFTYKKGAAESKEMKCKATLTNLSCEGKVNENYIDSRFSNLREGSTSENIIYQLAATIVSSAERTMEE